MDRIFLARARAHVLQFTENCQAVTVQNPHLSVSCKKWTSAALYLGTAHAKLCHRCPCAEKEEQDT
jgi:hypothetical protein